MRPAGPAPTITALKIFGMIGGTATRLGPRTRDASHNKNGNCSASDEESCKCLTVKTLHHRGWDTLSPEKALKHTPAERNARSAPVVHGIGVCKPLKESQLNRDPWLEFGNLGAIVQELRTHNCASLRFSLEMMLSAAQRATHRGDRAGLEDWKTDAAVRPTESEPVPALYRERWLQH